MSQLGPQGETQEAFNSPGLTLVALLGHWIRDFSVCPSARVQDARLRGILSGPRAFQAQENEAVRETTKTVGIKKCRFSTKSNTRMQQAAENLN